jgi:hypothetical protein
MITFDPYEMRARIIPTLIVLSPTTVIPLAFNMSLSNDWIGSAIVGLTGVSLLYFGSLAVRFLGKKIERDLWRTWGGPPSTTVLRAADRTFSDSIKTRIRSCIQTEFRIELDGLEEDHPDWSESVVEAFRLVRQHVRQHNPEGLWYVHDAEYGALRNFYGVANVMAAVAGVSTVLCAVAWWRYERAVQIWLCALAGVLTAFPLAARFYLFPSMLREAAFRYAESVWLCFLHCCRGTEEHGGKSA